MDLVGILKKYSGLFFYSLIVLFFSGCYSHFAIKESIEEAVANKREISKIKLKNEKEINFFNNENILISLDSDSLTYKNNKGEIYRADIKNVNQLYEYRFNIIRTFLNTIIITISFLGFFLGTYLLFVPPS